MRVGVSLRPPVGEANPIDAVIAEACLLADLGLELWMPQLDDGLEVLTTLAVVGRAVPGLAIGTSCVPIWPRHPVAVALQALTVQSAVGGRLTLGLGLSHRPWVEDTYGIPFAAPVRRMREFLEVLLPLLHGETVHVEGQTVTARVDLPLRIGDVPAPKVLVAALGPQMLRLAGRLTDGAMLWFVGARTLATHVMPHLTGAGEVSGRARPEVLVCLPVSVTADVDAALDRLTGDFDGYGALPSYRRVLDAAGATTVADLAIVGDDVAVAAQLAELEEAGATAVGLRPFGTAADRHRTLRLLGELADS